MKFGIGSEVGLQRCNNTLGVGNGGRIGLRIVDGRSIFGAYQEIIYPNLQLTINSITEDADYAYAGGSVGGCSLTSWSPRFGGISLSIIGSGADPTINKYNTYFNGGKGYSTSSQAPGDITTEDFVFEMILKKLNTGIVRYAFVDKRRGSNPGYVLYVHSSNQIPFYAHNGSASLVITPTSTSANMLHFMIFSDRSGVSTIYINGVLASAEISSIGGSLTSPDGLSLGTAVVSTAIDMAIGYVSMWKKDNWLDGGRQDAVALARYNAVKPSDFDS